MSYIQGLIKAQKENVQRLIKRKKKEERNQANKGTSHIANNEQLMVKR